MLSGKPSIFAFKIRVYCIIAQITLLLLKCTCLAVGSLISLWLIQKHGCCLVYPFSPRKDMWNHPPTTCKSVKTVLTKLVNTFKSKVFSTIATFNLYYILNRTNSVTHYMPCRLYHPTLCWKNVGAILFCRFINHYSTVRI
jgi:hypothetical protein